VKYINAIKNQKAIQSVALGSSIKFCKDSTINKNIGRYIFSDNIAILKCNNIGDKKNNEINNIKYFFFK
jgi:hypothetical protein